jgi:hypothetical protein
MSNKLLICTDLDRTLIPNGPQPESPLAREYFASLVSRSDVDLAYVSGRHRSLVEQAITDFHLPIPDFVIGDVGTTIYRLIAGHDWEHDESWEKEISQDWAGNTHAGLADLLAGVSALQLQEADKQNSCKLSYYVPLQADTIALSKTIEARLEQVGAHCRLIWSIDEPENIGLLDILPQRASKYHAVRALIRDGGFNLGRTVFCGDSGNDIEVLVSPVPSVLVANCSDEVRLEAISKAKAGGQSENLYIAHGGLLSMNGNYAAGMLEGIVHYHPETLEWMQLQLSPEVS